VEKSVNKETLSSTSNSLIFVYKAAFISELDKKNAY